MWERPLHEQVAVLRHDMGGFQTTQELTRGLLERLTGRVEHMEKRQTVMQEQLGRIPIITPEIIKAAVADVIDERTVMTKANRYDQVTQSVRSIVLKVAAGGLGVLLSAFVGWMAARGGP